MIKFTHNKIAPMTKKRKEFFTSLAFFAKELKIHKVDVTINLMYKYLLTETFGQLAFVEHVNARRLNLVLDANIDRENGLQTLAHEMKHVQQFIKNRLTHDKKGELVWLGKAVPSNMPWVDRPWEVEAMKTEVLLSRRYLHSINGIHE